MRLTVLWSPQAEASLASLWVNAAQRRQVSQADDEVDSLLREHAVKLGESLTVSGLLFARRVILLWAE